METMRWYVRVRGRVIGPLDLDQLKSLRDRGQFRRFHEVSEDRKRWKPASAIGELFPADEKPPKAIEAKHDLEDDTAPIEMVAEADVVEWFYLNADGTQLGPVDRAKLHALLKKESVTTDTLVWREGFSNWAPLGSSETGLLTVEPGTPERPAARRRPGRSTSIALSAIAKAHRRFFSDPVGGLAPFCEALGRRGALGVGIVFGAIFDICMVMGAMLAATELEHLAGLPQFANQGSPLGFHLRGAETTALKLTLILKLVVVAILPLASLAAAIAMVRIITGGRGNLGFDVLIAGAALLPMGLLTPLAALLGVANVEVIAFLYLMALCLAILLLNSGFTRVIQLSDRGAILAIPITLLITIWLSKVVVTSVLLK